MKFITVNDSVSVRKDEVIAVERTLDGKAKVVLEYVSYESNYPYETFLQFLEMSDDIEEQTSEVMNKYNDTKKPFAYLNPQQFWAG